MSALYNEYIIASNNSINDNKYNAEKVKSSSHKLKRMLKPILKMLRQKNSSKKFKQQQDYDSSVYLDNQKNQSIESNTSNYSEEEDFWSSEIDDNSANEELECRIFNEINECADDAAVFVYENDECEIQPIQRKEQFVPVHFARTEAGTFFWTTMQKPVDYELVQPTYCCSNYQQPQLQYGDRWVQA